MDASKHHAMRFPDSVCEYSRRVTAPWLSHSCELAVCVCCAVLCCAVPASAWLRCAPRVPYRQVTVLELAVVYGITLLAAAGMLWLVAAPVSCRMETNRKRLRKGMESNSMRSCMHKPAEGGRTGWCGGLWRSACPWVGPSGGVSLYILFCFSCSEMMLGACCWAQAALHAQHMWHAVCPGLLPRVPLPLLPAPFA